MRPENFRAVPLAILVVASLVAPLIALVSTSEAKVYPDVDIIFVRGKETAYSYNNNAPAPVKAYVQDDYPPMMMAQQIVSGRVVASGVVTEFRMTTPSDNFAELTDAIFRWLAPGQEPSEIYVRWFDGGYAPGDVYITSALSKNLLDKLRGKGYKEITGFNAPITPSKLAPPYDILVIPEIQLGPALEGGNPDNVPDADVQAVKSFVENGGGLLIMSGSDFFGPSGNKGNFYAVMNKFLVALQFGSGGKLFGFQSDSIYDDVNKARDPADVPTPGGDAYRPIVDVNTAHPIGAAYQAATGRTTVRAYGGCSLVQLGPGMAVYNIPKYQVGMPGENITYRFRVFNTGVSVPGLENVDLTIDLTVTDDLGWGRTLDNYVIWVPKGENQTVILSVTIPGNATLGTEDRIVVTAAAREFPEVRENKTFIACAGKRLWVTEDTYVSDQDPIANYGDDSYLSIGRYENFWQYAYLKFGNLAEIPPGANIIEAKLYLYCFSAYGSAQEMLACRVDDDDWDENVICWDYRPTPGATLDTIIVSVGAELDPEPYIWDVTSFIRNEFAGDKVASLVVRPADNCTPSRNRRFEAKQWWDNRVHPFLKIIYTGVENRKVSVSISPSSRIGPPGGSLGYTVRVKNEGNVADTYFLTTADNAGWGRTISPSSLSLAAGASDTATLTVTIPGGAENCTRDNVRVIATGTGVSAENSCIAHASTGPIPGVEVSISPASQDGSPGVALTYTVTVTNTGNVVDNYSLTKSDTLGWGSTLSETSLVNVENGASRNVTLTVTIPAGAEDSTSDSVTVIATSQVDDTVSESASCVAHCVVGVVPGKGVQVSISPESKSGEPGKELIFMVTVTNTGTSTDTFTLTASDTEDWGSTLGISSTTLAAGTSRQNIRLSITIPSTAADGDSTTITVRAAGTGYENSATCTATAEAATGGISPLVYVGAGVVIVVIIAAVLIVKPF